MTRHSTPSQFLRRPETAFFALAVAVHLLMLMLPIGLPERKPVRELDVDLRWFPPVSPLPVPTEIPPQVDMKDPAGDWPVEPAAASSVDSSPPRASEILEQPVAPELLERAPELTVPEPATVAPALDVRRLLQDARERGFEPAAPGPVRRLGEPATHETPHNWRPGAGAGMLASPAETRSAVSTATVVDRWKAADGSHNVMVELPNGTMLCGRAESWDPARPLVEHVMMFRDCGQAVPSFSMPEDRLPSRLRGQP